MSVKTYMFCDRCAADITHSAGVAFMRDRYDRNVHLCSPCADSFHRWLYKEEPS